MQMPYAGESFLAVSGWAEQGLAPKPHSLPSYVPCAQIRGFRATEHLGAHGWLEGLRAQVAFRAQVIETRAASVGAAFSAPGTPWVRAGSHRLGTEQEGPKWLLGCGDGAENPDTLLSAFS